MRKIVRACVLVSEFAGTACSGKTTASRPPAVAQSAAPADGVPSGAEHPTGTTSAPSAAAEPAPPRVRHHSKRAQMTPNSGGKVDTKSMRIARHDGPG